MGYADSDRITGRWFPTEMKKECVWYGKCHLFSSSGRWDSQEKTVRMAFASSTWLYLLVDQHLRFPEFWKILNFSILFILSPVGSFKQNGPSSVVPSWAIVPGAWEAFGHNKCHSALNDQNEQVPRGPSGGTSLSHAVFAAIAIFSPQAGLVLWQQVASFTRRSFSPNGENGQIYYFT